MADGGDLYRVGLVGARGHVGGELIRLLSAHPRVELAYVCSRELEGQHVADHHSIADRRLRYRSPVAAELPGLGADVVLLALPNGHAAGYVETFDAQAGATVLVDLSADYRFDPDWYYGLPELTRGAYAGERRISNPGCYATAMQLLLAPVRELLEGPSQCFGVSGYSGAGTTPSERNDPDRLRDNLMPYALTGHLHEREVSHRMAHPIEFMPHVAPHFRGLTVTANMRLRQPIALPDVCRRYLEQYAAEPLVAVQEQAPWVSEIAGRHGVALGGFALSADGRRLVAVATLDNLLKGAATQAIQNLNRALGLDEFCGLPVV